jgi:hypothetical protein
LRLWGELKTAPGCFNTTYYQCWGSPLKGHSLYLHPLQGRCLHPKTLGIKGNCKASNVFPCFHKFILQQEYGWICLPPWKVEWKERNEWNETDRYQVLTSDRFTKDMKVPPNLVTTSGLSLEFLSFISHTSSNGELTTSKVHHWCWKVSLLFSVFPFFETGSHCEAQDGLKFMVLLLEAPPPSESWDYSHVPKGLAKTTPLV